jgi:type IV pilus assembly protein PilC
MEAVPQLFCSPVPQIIAAAEKTSTLPAVMDRLESALARKSHQKALMLKSIAYPVTTLALAVPLILVASMVVLPEVASVFEQAGVKLPGPTMALVRLGLWTRRSWGLVVAIFTVLMLAVCYLARRGIGMAPHIPVLGRALIDAGWAGFCLTLADCVEAKMPPSEALSVAAGVVVWEQVRRPALDASAAVGLGVPLGLCLNGFHPAVKRELSLQREDMARRLAEVAWSLESASAAQVEALVSALQPVLTTLVAVIVGAASILICLPALSTMDIP